MRCQGLSCPLLPYVKVVWKSQAGEGAGGAVESTVRRAWENNAVAASCCQIASVVVRKAAAPTLTVAAQAAQSGHNILTGPPRIFSVALGKPLTPPPGVCLALMFCTEASQT